MKVDPDTGAAIPTLSGEDLLKTVPGMADTARLEVDHPFNIPSDCMGPVRWVALRESVAAALARDDVTGVIVAHGTDTLEETAWFLDLTIDSPKPVVMIGAQCNASSPDFDGRTTCSTRRAYAYCLMRKTRGAADGGEFRRHSVSL